jgi:hypothetical protein
MLAALALAPAAGSAQSADQTAAAPVASPRPADFALRAASFTLRRAYEAIADAQQLGGSNYLTAAKTHYRSAIERYGKGDPAAAAEAMAADALARAAMADHRAPAPSDLPTPPAASTVALSQRGRAWGEMHRPQGAMQPYGGMQRNAMHVGFAPGGRDGRVGHFDASRLAAAAQRAGSAEAKGYAESALRADEARTRAEFAGDTSEAMRQGRLASALSRAVEAMAWMTAGPRGANPA